MSWSDQRKVGRIIEWTAAVCLVHEIVERFGESGLNKVVVPVAKLWARVKAKVRKMSKPEFSHIFEGLLY